MTLAEYLRREKLKPAEFAASIGVWRQAVERYLDGQRIPAADVMRRIAKETGGAVTADDFYGLRASR